jgi:hypothetical protein
MLKKYMDKFTHRYSLLCQKTIIDSKTNNLSLIDIIEEIKLFVDKKNYKDVYGEEFGKGSNFEVPISFELVSAWLNNKRSKSIDLIIKFVSPSGKRMLEHKPYFRVDEKKHVVRSSLKINGLKLEQKSGEYNFVIHYRDNNKAKYKVVEKIPIQIKLVEK